MSRLLTLLSAPVAPSGPDLTTGLTAKWGFNGDLTDGSGNGNAWTAGGGTAVFQTGLIGQELVCASSRYAFAFDAAWNRFFANAQATMCGWIHPHSFSGVICYGGKDDGAHQREGALYGISGNGDLVWQAYDGTNIVGQVSFPNTTLTTLQRFFVMMRWDSTVGTHGTIYLDVLNSSGAVVNTGNNALTAAPAVSSTTHFDLGARNNTAEFFATADYDGWRLYNGRLLTNTERDALVKGGAGVE